MTAENTQIAKLTARVRELEIALSRIRDNFNNGRYSVLVRPEVESVARAIDGILNGSNLEYQRCARCPHRRAEHGDKGECYELGRAGMLCDCVGFIPEGTL